APAPVPPPPGPAVPAFPGAAAFGPGRVGPAVQQLGEQLVRKGYGRSYTEGPSPEWGEADRLNVQAFQRAQGWSGADADGYPGPETWRLLFS
ncbi:peptidoglycan-binding protein, partial [Kitasatospora sp. MBT63]|uniref:peptidoglycan-binding protein n=1 Tax=Kitasatospora sp. MBT63 TaxID=1444768 RepID=UPI00053B1514